jgi:hypothetical protein
MVKLLRGAMLTALAVTASGAFLPAIMPPDKLASANARLKPVAGTSVGADIAAGVRWLYPEPSTADTCG